MPLDKWSTGENASVGPTNILNISSVVEKKVHMSLPEQSHIHTLNLYVDIWDMKNRFQIQYKRIIF